MLFRSNAGCKMATESIEQIKEYAKDTDFLALIDKHHDIHKKIGEECHVLLNEAGEDEKDPHPMAKAFSWMKTEVTLKTTDEDAKMTELMLDGCIMGIKSLKKYLKEYKGADEKSRELTEKLIGAERDFLIDLLDYL